MNEKENKNLTPEERDVFDKKEALKLGKIINQIIKKRITD